MSGSKDEFPMDMYMVLKKESDAKNLFFSPFSLETTMAMVYMGAKGKTQDQMKKALHFDKDISAVKEHFKRMIQKFSQNNAYYALRTSNSAYISDKFDILEEFSAILASYFNSKAMCVNFDQSELVRLEINSNVEKDTNSLIKDLIPSGELSNMTCMVLANAIYFKGSWAKPFPPSRTEESSFWVTSKVSIPVQMMCHRQKENPYAKLHDLDAEMITLDYKGKELFMGIILPRTRDGLPSLEEKLESTNLSALEAKLQRINFVDIYLPKFKLEESFEAVNIFKELGVVDLFGAGCDLTGISENTLFVSKIFHKAFVEVNEMGTEAGAATAAYLSKCMGAKFVADRPFIFYIRERTTSQILFMGRLATPSP